MRLNLTGVAVHSGVIDEFRQQTAREIIGQQERRPEHRIGAVAVAALMRCPAPVDDIVTDRIRMNFTVQPDVLQAGRGQALPNGFDLRG